MSVTPVGSGMDAGEQSAQPSRSEVLRAIGGRLGDHWLFSVACGTVLIAAGVVVAVWPGHSVTVLAITVAIGLIISGQARMFMALGPVDLPRHVRVLRIVAGGLAMLVGVLCLRDVLHTLLALETLLGIWLVAQGVLDLAGCAFGRSGSRSAAYLATGTVGIIVGTFLMLNPEVSLRLFVGLTCIWLVVSGLAVMALGVHARVRAGSPLEDRAPQHG